MLRAPSGVDWDAERSARRVGPIRIARWWPGMRTQYYTASSLDGFIATEDHSLEWLFQLGDVNDTSYPRFIQEVGALAMGSSTYEWMLRHVIKVDSASPGRWPYEQPTWVFSSREQPALPDADIRFVRG